MSSPHSGQIHFSFSFLTKCLIPTSLIILRLSIMLIPYLALYRLSNCLNLAQGKLSQLSEQYLVLPLVICSQFLILQVVRHLDFRLSLLSILRQPGHVFFSRMFPQQSRQFIPHGAIKSAGIVVVFFRFVFVMTCVQFLFSTTYFSHDGVQRSGTPVRSRKWSATLIGIFP